VRVKLDREGDSWRANPTGNQGSGILSSLSRADGLLIGPSTETVLKAGAQATVLLLGGDGGIGEVTADELFEGRRHTH
jgi:molybdopterin molybdotransferase